METLKLEALMLAAIGDYRGLRDVLDDMVREGMSLREFDALLPVMNQVKNTRIRPAFERE